MELILRDQENPDFVEATVGEERAKELSKKLDEMVASYGTQKTLVYLKDTVQDIAFFCDNFAEFAYCMVLHMGYLQRRGHIITPNQ